MAAPAFDVIRRAPTRDNRRIIRIALLRRKAGDTAAALCMEDDSAEGERGEANEGRPQGLRYRTNSQIPIPYQSPIPNP